MICFDNLAQIEIIDDEPLREVIETLGGWPVATPGWDENNESVPSLEKLLAMLKRKFTLGVLLEEWIGPDDRHSEDNVIQVYIYEIARQNGLPFYTIVIFKLKLIYLIIDRSTNSWPSKSGLLSTSRIST